MATIKNAGTMNRYDAAQFLEELALGIRSGKYDVQSLFEGLEIASQELSGFRVHVAGQVQSLIGLKPSFTEQVKRMFHERNHTQGAWIETVIGEAEYRIENYFEGNDDLVEEAWEQFYTPELLYRTALRLWQDGDLWDNDYISDITWGTIGDNLPAEAFTENQN